MTEIHAYRNLATGERFAFGGPRPDLEVLANWEKIDTSEVSDAVVDAVAAQSHTARIITDAQKPISDEASRDPGGLGAVAITDPAPPVPVPGAGFGGVLSRNIVAGTPHEVLKAQAAADAESLATHGTLADNADGSKTRVHSDGLNADIVNAPPVGDAKKNPAVVKARKAVETETKRAADRAAAADKAAAERTAAADKAAAKPTG
jgi:hypothetical protein